MLSAVLALGLAQSPARAVQEAPDLPAPLAWLEDQGAGLHASRRLMLLESGTAQPRELLQPLFYSIDAGPVPVVDWLGPDIVVSGSVSDSRPAPTVAPPVHRVSTAREGRTTVPGITPQHVYPAPDGRVLVALSPDRLDYVVFEGPEATVYPLLAESHVLRRCRLRSAVWTADGRVLLVSAERRGDDEPSGLWCIPYVPGTLTDPPRFGVPERIGDDPAGPRQSLVDGSLLVTAAVEQDSHRPHEVRRIWPGTDRAAVVLADDLQQKRAAEVRPPGQERTDVLELAYVRFGDGALVLRTCRDGLPAGDAVPDRVLWKGPRHAQSVSWSADGAWLAFSSTDEEHRSWVHVIELEGGAVHRLAPGRRPAWGPAPHELTLQTIDGLAVLTGAVSAEGTPHARPTSMSSAGRIVRLPTLPIGARVDDGGLRCWRREDGSVSIHYMTFERIGDRHAYGTYSLRGQKNHMVVPSPLGNAPIRWADRNSAQALAHHLVLAGVRSPRARELVAQHGDEWLADGRRVFFFLPRALALDVPEIELEVEVDALMIRLEVAR